MRLLVLLLGIIPSLAFAGPRLNVQSYDVTLDVTAAGDSFDGTAIIDLWPTKRSKSIVLDALSLDVQSVHYEAEPLSFRQKNNQLKVRMPRKLLAQEAVQLHIHYRGSYHADGVQRMAGEADTPVWLSAGGVGYQPARVFPAHSTVDDPAFLALTIRTTPKHTVLAPGRLTDEQLLGKEASNAQREVRYELERAFPPHSYQFMAAPLSRVQSQIVSSDGRVLPLYLYGQSGDLEHLDIALHAAREAVPLLEALFDTPVPQDNLRIIVLPIGASLDAHVPGLVPAPREQLVWQRGTPELGKLTVTARVSRGLAWQWLKWPRADHAWGGPWLRAGLAELASQSVVGAVFGDALESITRPAPPTLHTKLLKIHAAVASPQARVGAEVLRRLAERLGDEAWTDLLREFLAGPNLHASMTLHEDIDADWRPVNMRWDFSSLVAERLGDDFTSFTRQWIRRRITAQQWKEAQAPLALTRDNVAVVFQGSEDDAALVHAARKLLQRDDTNATVSTLIGATLQHPSTLVHWGVLRAILDHGQRESALRPAVQKHEERLIAALRGTPRDLASAQRQAAVLELLGVLDDPDYYSLLQSKMSSPLVDVQLGAIAGVLHSSIPKRFASVHEIVRRISPSHPKHRAIIMRVAHIPQIEALRLIDHDLQTHTDLLPEIVATVLKHNLATASTAAGRLYIEAWIALANTQQRQAISRVLHTISSENKFARQALRLWKKIPNT